MAFEEVIRQKIVETQSKVARGILKVVLGEFQQKNISGKATDQDGYNIIEKIINGNKETMGFMKPEDPRLAVLAEESQVVSGLLPPYLTADEVLAKIKGNEKLLADVKVFLDQCDKSKTVTEDENPGLIGRAIGAVVKFCKAEKLDVKGDAVKEALTKLFEE